jgi:hypothetical protein
VLATVTCCAQAGHHQVANPTTSSPAYPGPPSATISFPKPLTDEIKKIEDAAKADKSKQQKPAKKAMILNTALADLLPQPFTSETTVSLLSHPEDYRFDTSKRPSEPGYFPNYFHHPFTNNPVTVWAEPRGRYDYRNDEVWVDFANAKLGGGVFGNGMVQEETMALSMPQLADAAAIGYFTRTEGKPGVLGSNPTPLVLTKVHRTIELDPKLYKDGWEHMTLDDIKKNIKAQRPNQHANVLAVAVEKLDGSTRQQTALDTLDDLFNTFAAAYAVARQAAPNRTVNTGPIGTGDFKNDARVIYVMQHLAAQQIGGVTMRYWSLSDADKTQWDNAVNKIVSDWTKDKDHNVKRLLALAHDCLSAPQCA